MSSEKEYNNLNKVFFSSNLFVYIKKYLTLLKKRLNYNKKKVIQCWEN